MTANLSRDSYDQTKNVQKKIFQQGAYFTDSDINEQIDIEFYRNRRILSCFGNHQDARYDDGFKVAGGHPNNLTVTIKAGNASFHIDADHSVLLTLNTDTNLSGFASWVAGGVTRTDIVYIDIVEAEYTASEDLTIVNPNVGEETCQDLRISWTFQIANNTTTMPTAPTGHVYRELGRITKDFSSNAITESEITLTLMHFRNQYLENMEIPLWTPFQENLAGSDAISNESEGRRFYVVAQGTSWIERRVIRFPYVYDPAHRYIVLHCECWTDPDAKGAIEVEGGIWGGMESWINNNVPTKQSFYLDPIVSGITVGSLMEINIVLKAANKVGASGNYKSYFQMPYLAAGLGSFSWS